MMRKFDVVIYGATLAGISAAYWLGRQGFSICVLEPSPYIGGAIAGGLSWQDFPPDNLASQILAGRVTGDFFRENAMAAYRRPLTDYTDRGLEPKTSARLLRDMLHQSNAFVKTGVRLEKGDVIIEKGRITAVQTADGPVSGDFWIGASYEGDLGHHAGITYTSGRESETVYGENRAGFRPEFAYKLPGFSGLGALVPPCPDLVAGAGDRRLQSFTFRVTVTGNAANRLPFPRPAGYDRNSPHLQLLAQMIALKNYRYIADIVSGDALPDDKYDLNSMAIVGCDCVGLNNGYAESGWAARDAMVAAHLLQVQSVLYYIQNDTDVPHLKADARRWGLCRDEFPGSPYGDGFTPTLYIREARRLVGATVLTQRDQETEASGGTPTKATRCTSWSYGFRDKHGVQYYVDPDDPETLCMEGNLKRSTDVDYVGVQNPPAAYDIPFEALMPRPGQIGNFAEAVCFSCSSIFWASARMEPNFGNLGIACAALAKHCLGRRCSTADYDYATVRADMRDHMRVANSA